MKPSIKTITIVIGTLLGAFLGFSIASTLVKEAEERGHAALRVHVDDQHLVATHAQALGKGGGRCCLRTPAFEVRC